MSVLIVYLVILENYFCSVLYQVYAMESSPTNSSVGTTWNDPVGEIDYFNVSCSEGDAEPLIVTSNDNGTYTAFCTNLPTSGSAYNMTVTSIVSFQSFSIEINLRACKLLIEY